jgi:hypothetical protein
MAEWGDVGGMVIYSTTVIGQDRRIAYNERYLRSAFPSAPVVYLDMLSRSERARARGFLIGGGAERNIRFPQCYKDGVFMHYGSGLYGR